MFGSRILARLAVCAAIAAPAWGQEHGVTDTEIVVGGILPYTGAAGLLGYAGIIGSRLAAAEINANGGIHGRSLRVVVEDDEYIPAKSVQAMQRLIDVHDVFSMNSISGGSQGLAVMPLIEENAIPTMNPLVTTIAHFDPPRPTVFGIGMTYEDGARELVKFIEARHGPQVWGSIVQDDESGIPRERGMILQLADNGRPAPALTVRYKRDQTDFTSEILRAREAGVTAIILGGLPVAHAAMLKASSQIGYAPVFGATWIDHIPPTIGLYGPEGNGVYIYDFVPSMSDPRMAGFLDLAREHLPADDVPKLNRYSVVSYIAMHIQAAAMQACGSELTRACVVEQIAATREFSSPYMEPISFGPGVHLSAPHGGVLRVDAAAGAFIPVQ